MQDRFEHFSKVLMNAEPDDIVTSYDICCEDAAQLYDFTEGATNVYRTKNYIVKQRIAFSEGRLGVTTVSNDVFYERTPERDEEYEDFFDERIDIDGRRVPAMGYIRKYVK